MRSITPNACARESVLQEALYYSFLPECKAKDKAVLVISHDDKYFHVADRVIRLVYGSVVEVPAVAQTI
jgi:putative pyoverdin transport system ATP-binding/permease protein